MGPRVPLVPYPFGVYMFCLFVAVFFVFVVCVHFVFCNPTCSCKQGPNKDIYKYFSTDSRLLEMILKP